MFVHDVEPFCFASAFLLAAIGAMPRQLYQGAGDLEVVGCAHSLDKCDAVYLDHPAADQAHHVGMLVLGVQFVVVVLAVQV
jgi:hypothetical protein